MIAGPAHGVKKLIRPIRVPVCEQQLGVGRERMNHLAAQNAVLAIPCFEIAIGPKGPSDELRRQHAAQELSVSPEPGIEDRDLDSLTTVTRFLPTLDAERLQVFRAFLSPASRIAGHYGFGLSLARFNRLAGAARV